MDARAGDTVSADLEDRIGPIVERVLIVELLAERGHEPTKRQGMTWTYHCPLPGHLDTNPSFTVKDAKWRCWSICGCGGDVVDLVMALDGINSATAIEQLAARIGLGREPRPQARGLSPEKESALLESFTANRQWEPDAVAGAGLSVVLDDFGRPRIRFPYRIKGRKVWHQDRAIGSAEPKWLAPKDSRRLLYNADSITLAGQRGGCWLLEGPCDVLALQSTYEAPAALGIPGVEGFRPDWVAAFADLQGVFLVADNDPAGEKLRAQLDALFAPLTTPLLHVRVPESYNDLDEWRRGAGADNDQFDDELLAAVIVAQAERDRIDR